MQLPTASFTTPNVKKLARFERAMVRIRWFGIALGLWQVLNFRPDRLTEFVPPSMRAVSFSALGLLVAVNVVVQVALRRPDLTERALGRLGAVAFGADIAALWGITFAFAFEEFGMTWIVIYVAPLEGAFRYRMWGAMLPVAISVPLEIGRELLQVHAYGYEFFYTSFSFRIGIMLIIAAVAGVMARDLESERASAETQASENAGLAVREAAARRESNAFQQVILAGVSETGAAAALQKMLEHIASDLGYSSIAVLMVREDERLHPVAAYGFPPSARASSVALGEGISGSVALSGRSEIIPDVAQDPRYFCVRESTRSQVTVPIRNGDSIIGVIDLESDDLDAFTQTDAARMERLGAQMALVLENARLLEQERATVERLRELDLMKSDFVAIASHELRTPLTAMQGSIKTLMRPDVDLSDARMREFLSILDRQSDRLTRLVEDLLIVSRIDAGHVSLRMEELDIETMLRDAVRQLGAGASRVVLTIAPDLPRVITDGGRIDQIVRNLAENALKFSPADASVRVAVHLAEGLVIEVRDEGPGIADEDVAGIFDRFHQVGGSLRRRGDGFGLGLYITKRLVDALGGTIAVDSVVGRGTSFTVRVPVAPVIPSSETA